MELPLHARCHICIPGTQHTGAAQDMLPAFIRSHLEGARVLRTAESNGSHQVSPGDTWQCQETFLVITTRKRNESFLASSGWEPGMLLSTGQPHNRERSGPKCQKCRGFEKPKCQEASSEVPGKSNLV